MTREEILNAAKAIICQGREVEYGAPEDNFKLIADFWSLYLTTKPDKALTSEDVAVMMSLMKIARIATGRYKDDTWIDLVGYAACGGEVASRALTPVPEPTTPEPKFGRHSDSCKRRYPNCPCNRCQHDTDEGDACCNAYPYGRRCSSTAPCPGFKAEPKRGQHTSYCIESTPNCPCTRCQHDTDEGDACCNSDPYDRSCSSTNPCPGFKEDEA